ncbi:MAG: hypothetical protein AB8C84_06685 [Oligoflexales bacterium]
MTWTWTIPFLIGCLFAFISFLTWWLLRQKRTRIWLPTVRILELPSSRLSNLRVIPLDIIGLFLFIGVVSSFLFFLGKPSEVKVLPVSSEFSKSYIFLDMSPSISSFTSLEDYAARVVTLWEELSQESQVFIIQSGDGLKWEPKKSEELKISIMEKKFHREGLKIGRSLNTLMQKYTDIEKLIVVSDKDKSSWKDFDWRKLEDQIEIFWYPAYEDKKNIENHFINQVRRLSVMDGTYEWDIDVVRNKALEASNGYLFGYYQGHEIVESTYRFMEGSQKATIRVEANLRSISFIQDLSPVIWKINSNKLDASFDDEFRSYLKGHQEDAVLIADPFSEYMLEDPVHDLEVTLQLFGFRLNRIDHLQDLHHDHNLKNNKFWLIAGGEKFPLESWCPHHFNTIKTGSSDKRIWLFPYHTNVDFQSLCECSSLLSKTFSTDQCSQVSDARSWFRLLAAHGAVQLGGRVNSVDQALGMRLKTDDGLMISHFSIPLKPMKKTGMTHSRFPIMLKSLLKLEGTLKETNHSDWPRISSVSDLDYWGKKNLVNKIISNVPLEESLLQNTAVVPQRWVPDVSQREFLKGQKKTDYKWGIKIAWVSFLLFSFLEIILSLKQMHYAKNFLLLIMFIMPRDSYSQNFKLSTLGRNEYSLVDFSSHLEQRTSLNLNKKSDSYTSFNTQAQQQPWLWVEDVSLIQDKDFTLKEDVVRWLRRGGLLIIQEPLSERQLQTLTGQWFNLPEDEAGWSVVPSDHEVSISFYLLNMLPSCHGKLWKSFQFDDRFAILYAPAPLLQIISDASQYQIPKGCYADKELWTRSFVNIHMVALTLGYKKDQTHMKEILKRL